MLRRPLFAFGAAVTAGGFYFYNNSDDRKRFEFVRRAFAQSAPTDSLTLPKKWDPNWDNRDPTNMIDPSKLAQADEKTKLKLLEEMTPKATRHLFMIRHGQYNNQGENDIAHTLTKLGREQATRLGVRLRDSGLQFDKMVISTMTRAQETAKLIAQSLPSSLPKVSDSMLEEGLPCSPDPPLEGDFTQPRKFLTDGARAEGAFRKYFHRAAPEQEKDSYELLVCHGNLIRYLLCRSLQNAPEGWIRMSFAHCSITWVMIRPTGRVVVRSCGDSGHLAPSQVTFDSIL